jgi:hypothetical protein
MLEFFFVYMWVFKWENCSPAADSAYSTLQYGITYFMKNMWFNKPFCCTRMLLLYVTRQKFESVLSIGSFTFDALSSIHKAFCAAADFWRRTCACFA